MSHLDDILWLLAMELWCFGQLRKGDNTKTQHVEGERNVLEDVHDVRDYSSHAIPYVVKDCLKHRKMQ